METAAAFCAFGEAIVFLDYFKALPDSRQRGKVVYPLDEVLLLCLLAVLAGSEAITDIARFGEKKLDLLRRFRPFRDGTPSHDHLGKVDRGDAGDDNSGYRRNTLSKALERIYGASSVESAASGEKRAIASESEPASPKK